MKHLLRLILIIICPITLNGQSGTIQYSVPKEPWPEYFGNHRGLINVEKASDAVFIDFLWRRHDASPEKHRMLIINAETGKEIKNIFRININNERCKLVFGPVEKKGLYYFYYLPAIPATIPRRPSREYMQVENPPDSLWLVKHQLYENTSRFRWVTKGNITGIQARTEFDSFYPMEVCATRNEVQNYLDQHKKEYFVFAEYRTSPIRMRDAIPLHWLQKLSEEDFRGKAKKNEYFTLQLGLFAAQKQMQNIRLDFSDLKDKNGNKISKYALTCFNTDGVDINGNHFNIRVDVTKGMVQTLWVGIDIPSDVSPGDYEGSIVVRSDNLKEQKVKIFLTIEDEYLADRGDGEPWRHSRLRWLNSTLGINNEPVAPYTSLVVKDHTISCLGRSVQFNNNGFPEKINCWGNNILASPIRFVIQVDNCQIIIPAGNFSYKFQMNGIVKWESKTESNDFTLLCDGEMEFDGRLNYKYEVIPKKDIHVQDIRLELPLKKEFAAYMMGMGRSGGYTPKNHISMWTPTEDRFWIGGIKGGIQCQLSGGSYHVPRSYGEPILTLNQIDPPRSWFNARSGGFRIDSDDSLVTASAFSGARSMIRGKSLVFDFALLITPVKEIDLKSQFNNRYFHSPSPTTEVIANGGNVMNVHHGNRYNPYINYPFIAEKELKGLVDKWHKQGWKVKIYYTVRVYPF